MPLRFLASPNPSGEAWAELEAFSPANPFCTRRYAEAACQFGLQTWLLGLREEGSGALAAGCAGFVRAGRLNRRLEIMSVADAGERDEFWAGLLEFCRRERICFVKLDGCGWTKAVRLPRMRGETVRATRCEYVIDLQAGDFAKNFCSSHRNNVKRAQKAGVKVVRSREQRAFEQHLNLIGASMGRRRERGEDVPAAVDGAMILAYLRNGAGELFQAVLDGRTLTSMLVLRSAAAGYDQTTGTSPEGMRCGSSFLVVHEVARILKEEGCCYFDLGGAEAGSGLAYFKAGFGARQVEQDSVQLYLGGALRHKVTTAVELLHEDRAKFLRAMRGRAGRHVVYAIRTEHAGEAALPEGAVFRKLTDEELLDPSFGPEEIRREQIERCRKLRCNAAYGVFQDGRLAHISWLVTAKEEPLTGPPLLGLGPGEVEITACVTLSEFCGRGLFGVAIRSLCRIARERGSRLVFMKTRPGNIASQRGIEKAGLIRLGPVVQVIPPLAPSSEGLILRPFRWRIGKVR